MICLGVSSHAGYTKHVIMLDIDNCTEEQAISIAQNIILRSKTSDFFVIESSKGHYHLICLDKVDWETLNKMIKDYSDPAWLKYRGKSNNLVIRVSKKKTMPKLRFQIQGKGYRVKSNAHRLLLELIYDVAIKKDKYFDNSTKVELHVYETRRDNHG